MVHEEDRVPGPFDRTYEGLKLGLPAPKLLLDSAFDRTYEGLKPAPVLDLHAGAHPLLTVPMRV